MDSIKELRALVGNRPLLLVYASVLVLNDRGEILLQRRSDTGRWGLPGGLMEPGETFEETARRELLEETGLRALEIERVTVLSGPDMYTVYPNGDEVHAVSAVHVVRRTEGELRMLDGESLELRWFPEHEMPPMGAMSTRIYDQSRRLVT